MTGAPMPAGRRCRRDGRAHRRYDEASAGSVEVEIDGSGRQPRPARAGEDVEPGDALFAAGTVLTAGHLGVLASVGVQAVEVVRRPKSSAWSPPATNWSTTAGRWQPGEIRDSNRRTLLTLVAEAGLGGDRSRDRPRRARCRHP